MFNKLIDILPEKIKRSFLLLIHRGNKYICPFCNYSSKDLAPIGIDVPVIQQKQIIGGGRRLGGCYQCGSTDRERLIYLYLKEKLDLFADKNKRILHIAPEYNLSQKLHEARFQEYICGDLFMEGYSYPSYVKNINILSIPYEDLTFDLIICNHVLEHIPDHRSAMKELNRVLKIGGTAILQVPISKNSTTTVEDLSISDPVQRELLFGQFDHVRIYGQDYQDILKKTGFKVSRINISKEFTKYGVHLDEDIYCCNKPF